MLHPAAFLTRLRVLDTSYIHKASRSAPSFFSLTAWNLNLSGEIKVALALTCAPRSIRESHACVAFTRSRERNKKKMREREEGRESQERANSKEQEDSAFYFASTSTLPRKGHNGNKSSLSQEKEGERGRSLFFYSFFFLFRSDIFVLRVTRRCHSLTSYLISAELTKQGIRAIAGTVSNRGETRS